MKRTYIDANVLIAAFNGKGQGAQNALRILDDPERKLVVSDYLRLEVLPKPTFLQRREEVEFMREVFDSAAEHLDTSPELTGRALALAAKYDLTPIDALHMAAATLADVDEFVTLEKPAKPMCGVHEIKVVSIYAEPETAQ